jgi:hypothetical protein
MPTCFGLNAPLPTQISPIMQGLKPPEDLFILVLSYNKNRNKTGYNESIENLFFLFWQEQIKTLTIVSLRRLAKIDLVQDSPHMIHLELLQCDQVHCRIWIHLQQSSVKHLGKLLQFESRLTDDLLQQKLHAL